jgi:hypothetical protein
VLPPEGGGRAERRPAEGAPGDGPRFDKLAVNYQAAAKLAMIERYLRLLTAN